MTSSRRYERTSVPVFLAAAVLAACGGSPGDAGSRQQELTGMQPVCFADVDGICTQVPSCDPNDPRCSCAGLVCKYVAPSRKTAPTAPRQLVCDCPVPGAVFAPPTGGTN